MRALLLIGAVFYLLPDLLFRLILIAKQRSKPRHTLAIIRLDPIGNMVLFAETCHRLVQKCRDDNHPALIVCTPSLLPLVKGWMPDAHIFGLDPQKLWQPSYRYRQLWRLHRFKIHSLFHPVVSHFHYLSTTAVILRSLPCPITIGYQTQTKGCQKIFNRVSEWHYKKRLSPSLPAEDSLPTVNHETHYHNAALAYFNAATTPSKLATPAVQTRWIFPTQHYILVAPGASHSIRQWPIGRFITVLQTLRAADPNLHFVIIGDANETTLGDTLRRHTGDYCIDVTGKTSLVETWDLVSRCELVLSNETGIAQMGAALHKKTITLTGGGHWGRFVPLPNPSTLHPLHVERPCYHCNWNCIYPLNKGQTAPCLLDISVDQVVATIQERLQSVITI